MITGKNAAESPLHGIVPSQAPLTRRLSWLTCMPATANSLHLGTPMLASLIIVFREVIEAGLIVGIVLAATRSVQGRGLWVASGIGAGVLGACVVAAFAGELASLF